MECRAFDRVKSGLWGVAATHLLFSLVTSVMVCLFLLSHPSALWLSPGSRNSVWLLPQALIAASTGFFGFVLWAEVSTRLVGEQGREGQRVRDITKLHAWVYKGSAMGRVSDQSCLE